MLVQEAEGGVVVMIRGAIDHGALFSEAEPMTGEDI